MKKPSKDLEKSLHDVIPEFIHGVMSAKERKIDNLIFTLDAFADDPELFYNAIWYATSNNIKVIVAPSEV